MKSPSPSYPSMARVTPREVARVRKLRKRLLTCFDELQDGQPGLHSLKLALDLLGIYFSLQIYRRKPAVLHSPLAREIEEEFSQLDVEVAQFNRSLASELLWMKFDKIIGHLLQIVTRIRNLLVQKISLIFTLPVEDSWSGYQENSAWPSFRSSNLNRGRPRHSNPPSPDNSLPVKKLYFGPVIWATPILDDQGHIYCGHGESEFVAFDDEGQEKWRYGHRQMMYIDSTGSLGRGGGLFMASTDMDDEGIQNQGRLWRFDKDTGEVRWEFWGRHFEDLSKSEEAHLSSFFEAHTALYEEPDGQIYLYAGSDDNHLYKLTADGDLVWEYNTGPYPAGVTWTKPCFSPKGDTVYIGTLAGEVHAVNVEDGTCTWRRQMGGAVVSSIAVGIGGELFFGCFDGKIYSIDPVDGEIYWTYQTLGLIYSSPAVADDGSLAIGSTDGNVYCIDRYGKKNWVYRTDGAVKSSPAIDLQGNVYIGNERGKYYCLSPDGRRIWSYLTNDNQEENDLNASPAIGPDGTTYIGSTDGNVYVFPPNHWYQNPDASELDISPHHDGESPPIPPGEARLVPCDRSGSPTFEDLPPLYAVEPLLFKLIAANEEGDVVEAQLVPEEIKVKSNPPTNWRKHFDGKSQYLLLVPDNNLEFSQSYQLEFTGKYVADGETRNLSHPFAFQTTPPTPPSRQVISGKRGDNKTHGTKSGREKTEFPLTKNDDSVEGIVLTNLVISQPKELDNLGQAALSALHFGLTPLYFDEEKGVVAMAVACLASRKGKLSYVPGTLNKAVFGGTYTNGHFEITGSIRVVAQGANTPVPNCRMSGYFQDRGTIDRGLVVGISSTDDVPEFAELVRIMKLVAYDDTMMGMIAFKTVPLEDNCLQRPPYTGSISVEGDKVVGRFSGEGPDKERWVRLALVDPETGQVLPKDGREFEYRGKNVSTVTTDLPKEPTSLVAILVVDMFPLVTQEIS